MKWVKVTDRLPTPEEAATEKKGPYGDSTGYDLIGKTVFAVCDCDGSIYTATYSYWGHVNEWAWSSNAEACCHLEVPDFSGSPVVYWITIPSAPKEME